MSCLLRKAIFSQRHIISAFSPSAFQHLLCVQTQWISVRYASSNSLPNGHYFTASYLIDTCGLLPEEAAKISKRVSFETRDKPDLVINFLKNQGFSKPQILRCIREYPLILRSDPEKTFLPKIEFFISRGVSSSDIPKLICSCPGIMRSSLNKHLIPSFDFFRDFFQSDDRFVKVLTYGSNILVQMNNVVPNMKLLREVGVPESNIIKLLQLFPKTLTRSTGRFKMIVEELQEMGFDPLKSQFTIAVYALSSLSKSTWSKKVNVYKKWGWSDNDILYAFRRFPFCMKVSEDKIDAIMKFLVDELGCPSSTIVQHAQVLSYSLNKRIVPRGSVFQVLLSKDQVKKERLLSIFGWTEMEFLKRFIYCQEKEASELLKLYQAKLDLAR